MLICDSWESTVGLISIFLNKQYWHRFNKCEVLKYKGIAQLKLAVSIFADRTKIQNDQNILDTCSAKTELISPKRSEKYFTQAEVVSGTYPDSGITACKK